jgi:hypothetical protein
VTVREAVNGDVMRVTFKKKERGRDLEWEVDDKRGEGWDSDPAKIHVAICWVGVPTFASLVINFPF